MTVRTFREPGTNRRLLLTCEHASADVPAEYGNLGLGEAELRDHIGWDIGAATVTEEIGRRLAAPAVLSVASRLVVDCNRNLGDHDLMPPVSHGVPIPGNAAIDQAERDRRLARFYFPYHAEIDRRLERQPDALLLSVHSFTPSLNGQERAFDIGVLFDRYDELAEGLAGRLSGCGFSVRMNEPYSALDGLIYSARHHGRRNRVPYLEIEINNRLLRSAADARSVGRRVSAAVAELIGWTGSGAAAPRGWNGATTPAARP